MAWIIVIGWWLLTTTPVAAQQIDSKNQGWNLSEGNATEPRVVAPFPAGRSPEVGRPSPTPTHGFWDRTNTLLFSGVALFRGLDYASTRNFQARGREEILLPDDMVNNSTGFASLEAAGTITSVGISYLLHRTGHHKLERWMSVAHIGVTGFGVVRNYSLKSRHPQASNR